MRCQNWALDEGEDPELCERCLRKSKKPFRVHCQQGQFQGKIDEPYFDGSWLYGSDRFLKFQSLPGNALPPDELARAEAAQKLARQDSEMKEKSAQPAKSAKKTTQASAPTAAPVARTSSSRVPSTPVAVELLDSPLEPDEVIVLKVKKIMKNEKPFWKDNRGGLYSVTSKGDVGNLLEDFPEACSEDD